MYNDIIEKLDFDKDKYILIGYFIRKIREDGQYPDITDLKQFMNSSIFRIDWRRRVIEQKRNVCAICGKIINEKGDLYVKYRGGYKAMLRARGIKTIDQAVQVKALWDVSHGEVRCKRHFKADRAFKYEPNETDAKYIKDYLKIDGMRVLSEHLHVDLEALMMYCMRMRLI